MCLAHGTYFVMQSIPHVIKGTDRAAQRLAFIGWLSGLGVLIAYLLFMLVGVITLAIAGLWWQAPEFAGALNSAATAPLAVAQDARPVLMLAMAAVASFGYWCRSQASSDEPQEWVKRLLSAVWRLFRLTFSPFLLARQVSLSPAGRALPLHPLERTLASTPAGLSGAFPLLI